MGTRRNRGFALLVVAVLIALMAIGGAALLGLIRLDLALARNARTDADAFTVAQGGLMEVLNDVQTPSILPTLSTPNLETTYTPSANSAFVSATPSQSYTAAIDLLRFVPVAESSNTYARALVYEVRAATSTGYGDAANEVASEIYKVVWRSPGVVVPERHAR